MQSYLPYSRGQLGGENRNNEAVQSKVYRKQIQIAESSRVIKNNKANNQYTNLNKELENK